MLMDSLLDKYQTYIFDLDGTLVDSVPDLYLALNHALTHKGFPQVNEDGVRQWVGNGSKKLVERALRSQDQWSEVNQETMHQAFLESYARYLNQESQLYPCTLETLQLLKSQGKTLALLTNKPIQFVEPLLRALNIVEYFSLMLGGDSLPEKKPSPLPLIHIMESLGQSVDNCLMIGDSRSDVMCAHNAKVDCVLLRQGYNQGLDLTQFNAAYLMESMSEFRQVLLAN